MQIGIVIALDAEARALPARNGRFLAHAQYQVQVSGPGPLHATAAARELLDAGCDALLSFGLAGGLDPTLRPGTVVVASAVRSADGEPLPCDARLHTDLVLRLATRSPCTAAIYGADSAVIAQADKHALHSGLQVVAVDMESAAIGRVARAHSRPFAVLRCVIDPASFTLPRAALAGIGDDGSSRPLASAAALLRHPQELPDLIRLALWYGAALRALRGAGRLLCR